VVVFVGSSRAATGPTARFGWVFAFHSTRLALTKKEANQSDFRNQKRDGSGGGGRKEKELTCRTCRDCLLVVAGKRSCVSDRSNTPG